MTYGFISPENGQIMATTQDKVFVAMMLRHGITSVILYPCSACAGTGTTPIKPAGKLGKGELRND